MSKSGDIVAAGHRNFRRQHEGDWFELEELLTRAEKKGPRGLDVDELLRLPVLYRATLSSLAIARETSLDKQLIDYLEALSTRAYFFVYGVRTRAREGVAAFFTHDWPNAVRGLWRETLVSAFLLIAGTIAGFMLVAGDPVWFGAIMGEAMAQGRGPQSSAAMLREIIYDKPGNADGNLGIFATFLFTHNTQVSIWCFALGFAFGVPPLDLFGNGWPAQRLPELGVKHDRNAVAQQRISAKGAKEGEHGSCRQIHCPKTSKRTEDRRLRFDRIQLV